MRAHRSRVKELSGQIKETVQLELPKAQEKLQTAPPSSTRLSTRQPPKTRA